MISLKVDNDLDSVKTHLGPNLDILPGIGGEVWHGQA